MNKAILIGRLTDNVEERVTAGGKAVAKFTLAINRDYKNADGKYDADYIDCVAYGNQAETISKYVHKGDRFGVIGRINKRIYENNEGKKVYVTEIIVDSFEFLESKKAETKSEPSAPTDEEMFAQVVDDETLPFN